MALMNAGPNRVSDRILPRGRRGGDMAIAHQRLTLEEFLRLPEEEPPLEFWHGEVTQKVAPKLPHGALQYGFAERISLAAGPGRPFRVFTETRTTLTGVSTVPDFVVYQRDRVPRDANGQVADDTTVPPDIAVEIVSPGQSRTRLMARCRWYVAHGVRLAVFAHPHRRIVRLFRPGAESGDQRGSDLLDLSDILPGFTLTVDDFFAPLSADW
jgi:Uma2 family endonuclease